LVFTLSEDKQNYSVTDYKGLADEVTIPSNYKNIPVTTIGDYAFSESEITKVVMPDSITAIGDYAFNFSWLITVTFSQNLISIGDGAFSYCKYLRDVVLPSSLTDVGFEAFTGSTGIGGTVENNPYFAYLPSKTNTHFLLIGASNTENYNLNLPADTKLIEGGLFTRSTICKCESISVDSESPYLSTDGKAIFNKDQTILEALATTDIASYSIPNTVKAIQNYAFYNCYHLNKVTLSSNLEIIGNHAFEKCTGISGPELPSTLQRIGSCAFYGCTGLYASFAFPSSLVSVGTCAFAESTIGAVSFGDSLTTIEAGVFADCPWLMSITIPKMITKIKNSAFAGCHRFTKITFASDATLESIGQRAFKNCSLLASITLPNSLESLGDQAFMGCEALTSVAFPASLKNLGYAIFEECEKIKDITFDPANTSYIFDGKAIYNKDKSDLLAVIPFSDATFPLLDSLTNIGAGVFANNQNLTSVVFPTKLKSIGYDAFVGCSFTNIDLPATLESIGNDAFASCSKLASVNFASDSQLSDIGAESFVGCRALPSIDFPAKLKKIGDSAFESCSFTSVTFPASLESIGDKAFSYSGNLKNIVFSSHSALVSIGKRSFSGCGLTALELPASLKSIGKFAFYDCSQLKTVTSASGSALAKISESAFENCSVLESVAFSNSLAKIMREAFCKCSVLASFIYDGTIEEWNNVKRYFSWNDGTQLKYIICKDGNAMLKPY
jgi:hypothetical protein